MASRPPAPKAVPQDTTDEFAVGGDGSAGEERRRDRDRERNELRVVVVVDFRFFLLTSFFFFSTQKLFFDTAPAATTRAVARETDPRRLEQRQKQIDFGKNTRGYQRYAAAVPR